MNIMDRKKTVERIKAECSTNVTLTQEAAKRFFKTSKNSYGANDKFLGITLPNLRKIAKKHLQIGLKILEKLLQSQYNEERLLALLILVQQYQKGDSACQEKIYQFYLKNLKYVNNWNLVDSSASHILGHYLWDKDRSILNELAKSPALWERRISIVATFYFIRHNDTNSTFEITKLLLSDTQDLIHKAAGWMLREAGKKNEKKLIAFLSKYSKIMPKTMLKYSTEKLNADVIAFIKSN